MVRAAVPENSGRRIGNLVRSGPLISLPGSAMATTTGQSAAAITRMSLRIGAPSRSLMAQHAALVSPAEYEFIVGQTGRPTAIEIQSR